MEAQLVHDVSYSLVAVAVRNGGQSSARAPWFFLTVPGHHVVTHAGAGFLGVGEGRYVITGIPSDSAKREPKQVRGVVGCFDPGGHHVVWSFRGGHGHKFRTKFLWWERHPSFERMFRNLHGHVELGAQEVVVRDDALENK
jgi:hypothetical protein